MTMSPTTPEKLARKAVGRRGLLRVASGVAVLGAVQAVTDGATAAVAEGRAAEDLVTALDSSVADGRVSGPFYPRRGALPVATPFHATAAGRTVGGFAQSIDVDLDHTRGYFAVNPGAALRTSGGLVLPRRSAVVSLYPDAPAALEYVLPPGPGTRIRVEVHAVDPDAGPAAEARLSVVPAGSSSARVLGTGTVGSGRSWIHHASTETRAGGTVRLALGRVAPLEKPILLAVRLVAH
jgi:hypothetical protein